MDDHSVCAEIQYGSVHSDLCPGSDAVLKSSSYRALLHQALDEWLNNADGDGFFYVGDATREHS